VRADEGIIDLLDLLDTLSCVTTVALTVRKRLEERNILDALPMGFYVTTMVVRESSPRRGLKHPIYPRNTGTSRLQPTRAGRKH